LATSLSVLARYRRPPTAISAITNPKAATQIGNQWKLRTSPVEMTLTRLATEAPSKPKTVSGASIAFSNAIRAVNARRSRLKRCQNTAAEITTKA